MFCIMHCKEKLIEAYVQNSQNSLEQARRIYQNANYETNKFKIMLRKQQDILNPYLVSMHPIALIETHKSVHQGSIETLHKDQTVSEQWKC